MTYHIELVPGVEDDGTSSGELTEVAIQNSQTNLVSVTGSYTDAIAAEVPVPDYQALAVGASVPVQTTVTNLGTQPITSIDFQVGGVNQQAPVTIQPGESATVTTNYTVVETAAGNGVLANPDYTVTATFGSGATARAAASTGTINLNVPNLGVSTFETVQQEDGKRVLRFSLYNNSAAQLENSGRTVKVGLFSDPECTMPIESQYASFCPVSTGTRANGAEFTIDSTTDLAAIDQGAYAGQITMDLAAYAKSDPENYMENGEIRSGGVTVDVTFIPEDWPFVDVTEDKWYYDAVAYVYQQGIMVGMSETTFEPNTTVNRAQVVQMLYNLEGQPRFPGTPASATSGMASGTPRPWPGPPPTMWWQATRTAPSVPPAPSPGRSSRKSCTTTPSARGTASPLPRTWASSLIPARSALGRKPPWAGPMATGLSTATTTAGWTPRAAPSAPRRPAS